MFGLKNMLLLVALGTSIAATQVDRTGDMYKVTVLLAVIVLCLISTIIGLSGEIDVLRRELTKLESSLQGLPFGTILPSESTSTADIQKSK